MKLLDKTSQQESLTLAREAIAAVLFGKRQALIKTSNKALNERHGVFITLYRNKEIRGCVGFYETSKRALFESIQETAVMSLNDTRFEPVAKVDADKISFEISIITKLKKVGDWHEIVLGKQGVVIKKDWHWGGLLPNQMVDLGLNLEGCLGFICETKAGLPKRCYRDPSTRIYVIETQRFNGKLLV